MKQRIDDALFKYAKDEVDKSEVSNILQTAYNMDIDQLIGYVGSAKSKYNEMSESKQAYTALYGRDVSQRASEQIEKLCKALNLDYVWQQILDKALKESNLYAEGLAISSLEANGIRLYLKELTNR